MKKMLLIFGLACLVASSAWAFTMCYSWEDGGTVLGQTPAAGFTCTNVTTYARTGTHSLYLLRTCTATPQAYVAWIKGLTTGDIVTGQFYVYDTTPSTNPSGRIWAHYANSTDPASNLGSASGSNDYSGILPGPWGIVPNTVNLPPYAWTFSPTGTADALMIEVRSYGTAAGANEIWVDDIQITAPDRGGVTITFPGAGFPSAVDNSTWGGIKALYR